MSNMTNRSNRLRLVIKNSGKTAKELINSFEEMETDDLQLPKDPITISRHINAKRAFDIDMAVAYGKALDADPADICFEPVMKQIWGKHDPETSEVTWFVNKTGMVHQDLKTVMVPRSFHHNRYKVIEEDNIQSPVHGSLLIYEQLDKSSNQKNKDFFNSPCLIQLEGDDKWIYGFPKPSATKGKFDISFIFSNFPKISVNIIKLFPVVTIILPHFYRHHKNY